MSLIINKFEQVSSDHHQMSLAGGGGRSLGLMSAAVNIMNDRIWLLHADDHSYQGWLSSLSGVEAPGLEEISGRHRQCKY